MPKVDGRIKFPGNPWPAGNAIKSFRYSARFVPESGIWIDLHLETELYYANSRSKTVDDEGDDWTSTGLWRNFHSCTLSSTKWADAADGAMLGVLAGTEAKPLDLSKNLRLTCDEDPKDPYDWPRPFAVYLLGHDAVADHRIQIKRTAAENTFDIDWAARLALIYGGGKSFDYEFKAKIKDVVFQGIRIPAGGNQRTMIADAVKCLRHPESIKKLKRKSGVWLVLK